MSASVPPAGAPDPRAARSGRDLRISWVALALLPVAFVVATLLGEWLLTLRGYTGGAERPVPAADALLAGVPALLVLVAPAVTSAAFGWRARRHGRPSGLIAATVGTVATLGLLVLNIAAFAVGR